MDWDHIITLMHVVEKCQGHPRLDKIQAAALAELQAINDEAQEEENA
jgi:hypothetical protein